MDSSQANLLNLWLRVAAVFLVLCASVYYLKFHSNQTTDSSDKILVSNNQIVQHELEDQSIIWLNKNSALRYNQFTSTNRQVALSSGEAYFDIAHDPEHPFEVILDDKTVKVLGTEFNIEHTQNGFKIDVLEGLVAIIDQNRTVQVEAGETLISDDISMSIAKSNGNNLSSWKTGELIFVNSSIIELSRDLSKYYGVPFKLDPSVNNASCLINTKFTNESIEEVLSELQTVYGFEFKISDQHYTIVKTKC